MIMRSWRLALVIVGVIGCAGVVTTILLAPAEYAPNAGSRERLGEALRVMGQKLWVAREAPGEQQPDLQDFIALGMQRVEHQDREGEILAQRHGITLSWHQDEACEQILFYPLVISSEVCMDPQPTGEPSPQIVMVPVDPEDIETLPTLYGCTNASGRRLSQCQVLRMKALFAKHRIRYAAALMSDWSVVYVPVDRLGNAYCE